MTRRIHITGASGCGTTSLGRALSQQLDLPHFDADDFYWLPTPQAYSVKREPAERLRLMHELFTPGPEWILSGSAMGWGDDLRSLFDLIVFLQVPTDTRLARLHEREHRRFGAETVAPGGERHEAHVAFLEWAAQYDRPNFSGRNLRRHEDWLAKARCPVLRLSGSRPISSLVAEVEVALKLKVSDESE